MEQSLATTHHLLDLIQVSFIITDAHSKILYANRSAEDLFGYEERGKMEGERIRMFFLEEDLTYFLPNIVYLTLYKGGFEGEALLRQRDGTKIFVYLSTNSFKEGGETFLTFSFQEIQRLKKLEKRRLEMEHWASLGKMVEEIAHQVRNPIASIGGYTQRLQRGSFSPSKSRSYLEQILRETKKLETMIHRVEEYVLIPRPAFRREKIEKIIQEALQTFSKNAAQEGFTFTVNTTGLGENGALFLDRELMIKALSHILTNSLDAIKQSHGWKKGATVNISLVDEGEGIRIAISDKGEGISKRNLTHIFEPFFSTRPDRIGLGLPFAKRVVEVHGGRIWMESRLKRGTTTHLFFYKDRRQKARRESISNRSEEA